MARNFISCRLFTKFYSDNKIKVMRWVRYVNRMGEIKSSYNIMVKHEGKRLLGRTMSRWEGNIRMDLREIGL
jgi:hypothetical protein